MSLLRSHLIYNDGASPVAGSERRSVIEAHQKRRRARSAQGRSSGPDKVTSARAGESEAVYDHALSGYALLCSRLSCFAPGGIEEEELDLIGDSHFAAEANLCASSTGGLPSHALTAASPDVIAVVDELALESGQPRAVRRYRKSLKPTSSQLEALDLQPGPNPITFSVSSPLQGTKTVTGTIYLWPRNAKIVVSDVDGTITRSDVWGQLMPIVGRDWSHPGVAHLFSNIRQSDYKILYLTARAIGQADSTRDYLFGLTQGERSKLPDGPLVLSPDRLFPSFKREVIDRKPYVFKIAALRDIRKLFPAFYNPFYAGFGNRDTVSPQAFSTHISPLSHRITVPTFTWESQRHEYSLWTLLGTYTMSIERTPRRTSRCLRWRRTCSLRWTQTPGICIPLTMR